MKKLLFLLLILVASCKSGPYTKGDICEDLLSKRSRESCNGNSEAIIRIDSLFIRCDCDTLK